MVHFKEGHMSECLRKQIKTQNNAGNLIAHKITAKVNHFLGQLNVHTHIIIGPFNVDTHLCGTTIP